ncbi:transposase [Streptomyces sp. IB201691-2A2]|uniref:transposase n=1 Tax=Streptomyces sp. IB201691-2A2 TaxID=2561920 RepID=UPI001CA72C2C
MTRTTAAVTVRRSYSAPSLELERVEPKNPCIRSTYAGTCGPPAPRPRFHAKATTATLRAHLVHVPARLARTARIKLTAHLPANWPWQAAYQDLFEAVRHSPSTP